MDWYVLTLSRLIYTSVSYHISFVSLEYLYRKLNIATVIVLIAAEILVAAINIVVDLYAGVD